MKRRLAAAAVLALGMSVGAQDDKEVAEFLKKRTKVETFSKGDLPWVRVTVDGQTFCEVAGKVGKLDVIKEKALGPARFLQLKVDDEEVLRLWVRSLAKPIDTAPLAPEEFANVGMSGSGDSIAVRTITKRGLDAVLFEAKSIAAKPVKCELRERSRAVLLGEVVVYRTPIHRPSIEEMRKAVLERINHLRKVAGVDPVVEDPALSVGCQRHAEYMRRHIDSASIRDAGAHRELKELEGYSEEGHKSAQQSVINWRQTAGSIADGIDALVATLYHRLPLLNPRLTAVGIGAVSDAWKVLVVDIFSVDWKRAVIHPLIYPASDQKEVPRVFALGGGEWPDPRPEPKQQGGYPITLQFDNLGWQPTDVRAILKKGDVEIGTWVSTPEAPAQKAHPQRAVCILPKVLLEPSTSYVVTVECKQAGVDKTPAWSKTWSFTTEKEK